MIDLNSPRNVKRVYYGIWAICIGLLLGDLFYTKHVHFAAQEWFGFAGLYGFAAAVFIPAFAVVLRKLLMRGEDYYDR